MRKWRIEDSAELYNVTGWGLKYFSINDKGHVQVTPYEGAITPPANNAGLRPGYWALLPFPSPSAGHLPYRLPQGFHHPPLSVGAHHGLISASKVSFVILL